MPDVPKSSTVSTMPVPNSCAHTRFTITRDVSGFSFDTSHLAIVNRLGAEPDGSGGKIPGVPGVTSFSLSSQRPRVNTNVERPLMRGQLFASRAPKRLVSSWHVSSAWLIPDPRRRTSPTAEVESNRRLGETQYRPRLIASATSPDVALSCFSSIRMRLPGVIATGLSSKNTANCDCHCRL